MNLDNKRKKIARVLKNNMGDKSAWKISREYGAPTSQSIERLLKGENANLNTLLFVAQALGGEIEITFKNK